MQSQSWLAFFTSSLLLACSATGSSDTHGSSRGGQDASAETPDDDDLDASTDVGNAGDSGDPGFEDEGGIEDAKSDSVCHADRQETSRHPVDIVFVVDNSGSMGDEIKQIKDNINAFAGKIGNSGLDYRVFMISQKGTSSLAVCVPEPLANANCATKTPRFYAIDKVVSSTDALIKLLSTYDDKDAVDPFSVWQKFVRFNSWKIFVAVTDDNSSLSADKFEDQLFAKPPSGIFGTKNDRKYIFHSIIGWDGLNPPPTTKKCVSAANAGSVYQELSLRTGGIVETICREDWSHILNAIADGVVKNLGCEFNVPQPPEGSLDPNLVEVQVSLGGGAPETMPRVLDEASCSLEPTAFYFDSNTAPTKVELCPGACARVSQDPKAAVSVLVGCPAPPPR